MSLASFTETFFNYSTETAMNSTDIANISSTTAQLTDLNIQYRNDYIVGFFFMLAALPGLLLYIPVMIVLLHPNHKDDFSSSFYVIVKSLGFADVFALILWILVAFDTLTHGNTILHDVSGYCFWLLDVTWVILVWHLVLMSLNRYVAICHMTMIDTIFSTRNTLIAIVIVYIIAWLVVFAFAFPCCLAKFSLTGYYPVRDTSIIWYKIWQNFDFVEFPLAFVICCISQLLVTLKYRSIKRAAQAKQTDKNNSNKKKDRKEFRMFIQTVMVCLAFLICDLLYNTVWLGTSDIWINFFTGMWLWEINNMIGPIIYLIFNPSIRTKVISLVFGKRLGRNRINNGGASVNDTKTVPAQLMEL